MAIRTLKKDNFTSMELLLEISDSGKFFLGATRNSPRLYLCYTFDTSSNKGCLLDIIRKAETVKDEPLYSFELQIDPKRKVVSYYSRNNPDLEKVYNEISRAYKLVNLYRTRCANPEVELYLCLKAIHDFDSDIFKNSYRFAKSY